MPTNLKENLKENALKKVTNDVAAVWLVAFQLGCPWRDVHSATDRRTRVFSAFAAGTAMPSDSW